MWLKKKVINLKQKHRMLGFSIGNENSAAAYPAPKPKKKNKKQISLLRSFQSDFP